MTRAPRRIFLHGGLSLWVSHEDYDRAAQHSWRVDDRGYVARTYRENTKSKRVRLHRFVLGLLKNSPESRTEVDHINGNKLDNRRCNLRICTSRQNRHNMKIGKRNASGYKGVSQSGLKWQVRIVCDGKHFFGGVHQNKEVAARAYDSLAAHLFGEFAWLNFPDETPAPAIIRSRPRTNGIHWHKRDLSHAAAAAEYALLCTSRAVKP